MNRPQITDADLLSALVPDSPAGLAGAETTPAAPAPTVLQNAPTGPLTVAYHPGPDGTLVPVYVPVPMPAAAPAVRTDSGPLVPRWAVGTAVVSVGVGAGGWMLAGALNLMGTAVTALAAGATAGLPLLVVAGVAVAALAGRRSNGGGQGTQIVQTITQTITQSVRIGE
ncbi:hypothetical protein OG455_41950 [Kitasatospora sp. NBC_01287]|uniref:hypothetical protein n=1 Tax=Kitasatospora sp. NBC_01287 TaxID=2903573 RepID=UPI0022561A1A|nr:hypothetical protein [Kitasatospora sp. NBC_01287]MCX4752009.1 hypothetical protein [Kitasatospora sp. NBC_01287]